MFKYDLSFIILNYRNKNLVKYCIKGIEGLSLDFKYEIIVVDNKSNDGCEEMIKKNFLQVKFIAAKNNRGYATGNNLGIKNSQGKYIVIINPDVAVFPATIEKLFKYLEANPEVGIVGPKLLNPDQTLQYSCGIFPDWRLPIYRRSLLGKTNRGKKWLKKYLMISWDHNEIKEVDWLFGAFLFIRKSCLDKVGLFDERFFLYLEDTDLCRRFWRNGYKVVYNPEVSVIHYHQRNSAENKGLGGLFKKTGRIHLYSFLKYYLKYLGQKNPHQK